METLVDQTENLHKLAVLLKPADLLRLVRSLEAVMDRGNGEVTVAIKQGNPVFIRTAVTESCQR